MYPAVTISSSLAYIQDKRTHSINSFIPFREKNLLPAVNYVTHNSLYIIYFSNAFDTNKKIPNC